MQMNLTVASPAAAADLWCVYEHWMGFDPTKPFEVMYIASCKLVDVFHMHEARNNSEWLKLAEYNPPMSIRIISTHATAAEANNAARRHIDAMPEPPRCNKYGFALFRTTRAIKTDDNREFANQAEAAKALGCTQSAVSQHLNGRMPSIKGVKLSYVV